MNRSKQSLRLILTITFGGMMLVMVTLLSLMVETLAARQIDQTADDALTMLARRMTERLDRNMIENDMVAFSQSPERLQLQEVKSQIDLFIIDGNGHILLAPEALADITLPSTIRESASRVVDSSDAIVRWDDGRSYVTVMMPSQTYQETPASGWLVLARQPTDIALASISKLRWQVFGVGALVAFIFGLLVWHLAGRLTAQLRTITQAAEQVHMGVPNATIPILAGNAEVASLSQSLNQLITDLTTATTAERNRIARELHDSVTQTLFAASMLADVLPQLWEANPDAGRTKLNELRQTVRGALAEMRTLLLELRPAAVVDAEWNQLLRQLSEIARLRAGVEVTWRIDGDCILPADVKLALYRVMQEALNNVAKYAEAAQAQVFLRCRGNQVTLTIVDDGRGFDMRNIEGDHFGLQMMHERVEAIGGQLHIQSELEQGTEVRVFWQRSFFDLGTNGIE